MQKQTTTFSNESAVGEEVIEDFQNHQLLDSLGFVFEPVEENCLNIAAVPEWCFQLSNDSIKSMLKDCFKSSLATQEQLEKISQQVSLNAAQVTRIIKRLGTTLPDGIAKPITSQLVKSLF